MICDQLDLVVKAQAGDNKARNELIETNLDFIRYVVIFYVGKHRLREYLSDGVFGFIRALKYFDVTKIRKHTNAIFWLFIHNEITNTNRRNNRSLDYAEKTYRLAMRYPIPRQPDYEFEIKELWGLLYRLTEEERIIVTGRLSGTSSVDLGKRFNCGHPNISRIYCRALKKLRVIWDSDLSEC